MADSQGNLGWAQVFQPKNNLLPLLNLKQRQDQFTAEQQAVRQKQSLDWYDKMSKLDFEPVSFQLTSGLTDSLVDSYKQMNAIYRSAENGVLDPNQMQTINMIRSRFDGNAKLIKSLDNDIKHVNEVLKADKDGLYDKGAIATKLNEMTDPRNIWFEDELGDRMVNPGIKSPTELLADPNMINDHVVGKQFVAEFSDVMAETITNPGLKTIQTEFGFKGGLYETKPDGSPKFNNNTGKFIPKLSPENIAMWDSSDVRKAKLDQWAKMIAEPNENWESKRAEAFKRFVIEPHAGVSKKVSQSYQPEYVSSRGQKEADVKDRYETIRKIVYDADESRLAQSFDLGDNIRVEFAGGGSKGNLPGEMRPDRIKIFRREPIGSAEDDYGYGPPSTGGEGGKPVKYHWVEYDPENPIWINSPEQQEAAIFKINELLDAQAGKSGLVVGNDPIRKIHENYKKATQKKQSEADQLGLN